MYACIAIHGYTYMAIYLYTCVAHTDMFIYTCTPTSVHIPLDWTRDNAYIGRIGSAKIYGSNCVRYVLNSMFLLAN